jgi:hypothetical protein
VYRGYTSDLARPNLRMLLKFKAESNLPREIESDAFSHRWRSDETQYDRVRENLYGCNDLFVNGL